MMNIVGVTESMTRLLRLQIITGLIAPGAKLNEIELSKRFGVSRPPLREAFRKLEYEQLVQTIPRKGTYVTKLSIDDCKEVYFTRCSLECAAIDAIAENKVRDFGILKKAIKNENHTVLPPKDDAEGLMNYYKFIAEFHWSLVEISGNRWLQHCYQSIGSALIRYQIIYYEIPGTRQPAIDDHTEILRLMQAEQYAQAKEFLVAHIMEGLNMLIAKMRKNRLVENYEE